MKLSIIVPVHNEELFIEQTLNEILNIPDFPKDFKKEIIVVNDGSNDKSLEIIKRIKIEDVNNNFILISHSKNLGKGQAIKTGLNKASGDWILIQDADLEYHSKDIPLLLNSLKELLQEDNNNRNLAIYGNRGTKLWPKRGYHYILGAKFLAFVFNTLYSVKIKDLYTGYKIFNREEAIDMKLESNGFEFEAEISCKILNRNGKIKEIPISYYKPRSKKEGKHIGFKDAIKGLLAIFKYRFFT